MDALDDYDSEADEDYVPGDEADEQLTGQHGSKGQRGTKRKRAAGRVELSAPMRVPMAVSGGTKKSKGPTRIGAAVLSDDDDDLMQLPPHREEKEADRQHHSTQQSQQQQRKEETMEAEQQASAAVEERKEDGLHVSEEALSDTCTPASRIDAAVAPAMPQISATLSSSALVASSSPSLSTATSTTASTPPATSTTTPPASASAKGGDLASILAQFNKKPANTKPAVKKVINPWELPAKPKPTAASSATPAPSSTTTTITLTPTTAHTAPSAATANTTSTDPDSHTTTTSPTTTSSPTATTSPTTTSPTTVTTAATTPSPSAALTADRVVVQSITSYAGDTIQITKTLIRGSAEEVAHRQSSANNLSTLIASLTSQRSINTLEKSRLDWSLSKEEEGDEDELRRFVTSKEALVDRMAFLARTEQREWERVKGVRDEGKRQTMTANTEGMDGD